MPNKKAIVVVMVRHMSLSKTLVRNERSRNRKEDKNIEEEGGREGGMRTSREKSRVDKLQ